MSSGPTGNLCKLWRTQTPGQRAIEFDRSSESDMVNVHIQPHADRVGGDEIINVSGLIQLNLGIAGAGGQASHDNGGAAPLTPYHFGDGIYIV